jgi:hypothetical protein
LSGFRQVDLFTRSPKPINLYFKNPRKAAFCCAQSLREGLEPEEKERRSGRCGRGAELGKGKIKSLSSGNPSAIITLVAKKTTCLWKQTRPVGQGVKTPPFHGGNRGSNPLRVTIFLRMVQSNDKRQFHIMRLWWNGRHAILRGWCPMDVQVQILSTAYRCNPLKRLLRTKGFLFCSGKII